MPDSLREAGLANLRADIARRGWSQADLARACSLTPHAISHLMTGYRNGETATHVKIAEALGADPEWWAYYADYDWVALCQLYGRMIDLPAGWPMYCRDVKQLADQLGVDLSEVPQMGAKHNALVDAEWCSRAWMWSQ